MLEEVTLQRSAIAYVYRENPSIKREDSLAFYDRVTTSGIAVPQFSIEGPELILLRKPAPAKSGALEVRVGAFGPAPRFRLLIAQRPTDEPVKVLEETADIVWEAFQRVWGKRLGEPALTEVTLDSTLAAGGSGATEFLSSNVADLDPSLSEKLGRQIDGVGLRFMSGAAINIGEKGDGPALPGAQLEMRVETLMDDPGRSQLFLQTQAKWPALTFPRDRLPPQVRNLLQEAVLQVNQTAAEPSRYLQELYGYLTQHLVAFLRSRG